MQPDSLAALPVGIEGIDVLIAGADAMINLYWVRKLDRAEEAKARPHIHPLFPNPNL